MANPAHRSNQGIPPHNLSILFQQQSLFQQQRPKRKQGTAYAANPEKPLNIQPFFEQTFDMTVRLPCRIWSVKPHYVPMLRQLIEKTQQTLNSQPTVLPFKSQPSEVYAIKETESKPLSYFKHPLTHACDFIYLEILMWNIAQILDWDDCFVPTAEATLSIAAHQKNGSLQPAVEGLVVNDLKMKNASFLIKFDSLLKVTARATILGAYDLHGFNAIVDDHGVLHLFDNIRSLAHSNEFIYRSLKSFYSPLRLFTLVIPEGWEPLKAEQKQKIADEVQDAKRKIGVLGQFLNTSTIKQRIEQLPQNWFLIPKVLSAYEERITELEKALKEGRINCLADIPLCTSEGCRINAGLCLATRQLERLEKKTAPAENLFQAMHDLAWVGYGSISALLESLLKNHIDAREIIEMCKDKWIPFDQLIPKIYGMIKEIYTSVEASNQSILKELSVNAVPDWKDIGICAPLAPKAPIAAPQQNRRQNLEQEIKKLDENLKQYENIKRLYQRRLADLSAKNPQEDKENIAQNTHPVAKRTRSVTGQKPNAPVPKSEHGLLEEKFKPLAQAMESLKTQKNKLESELADMAK